MIIKNQAYRCLVVFFSQEACVFQPVKVECITPLRSPSKKRDMASCALGRIFGGP